MTEVTQARLRRIVLRMLSGDEFYTNESPRISWAEIKALDNLGLTVQVEHTHGVQAGPIAVYPLRKGSEYGGGTESEWKAAFRAQAIKAGLLKEDEGK